MFVPVEMTGWLTAMLPFSLALGFMFNTFDFFKGDNNENSNNPNSPYFAGGSYNKSYDAVKSRALGLFNQANSQPLQFADASGFMPYQRAGMQEFARNLFSGSSAASAARGMVLPQNFDNVVGSALTRALPNLFAIQNENQFMPARVGTERLNLLNPMIQAGQSTLGPGIGYGNNTTANSNYWSMMNNIGSFWGGGGMKGAALKGGGGNVGYFSGAAM